MPDAISLLAPPPTQGQSGPVVRTLTSSVTLPLRGQAPPAERDVLALALGSRLSGEIRAMVRAENNARDGATLLQVADAALAEIETHLERMEELADDAAEGDLSSVERGILNAEFADRRAEIDSIAAETEFNGSKILSDGGTDLTVKVGADADSADDITFTIQAATAADLATGLDSDEIYTVAGADQAAANVVSAQNTLADIQASVAGAATRFASALGRLSADTQTLRETRPRVPEPSQAADLARALSDQVLETLSPLILTQSVGAMRDLLLSAELSSAKPVPAADDSADSTNPVTTQTREAAAPAAAADGPGTQSE